jgi:hypothetical protein
MNEKTETDEITWFLNASERMLYNLNVIDFSEQFNLVVKKCGEVEKHYSIRYDLSCFIHNVSNKNSYVANNFFFFNSDVPFDDFCTRFCDVKIYYLELDKEVSLDYVVKNFNDYSNVLFKSCLFQMRPIYSCLKINDSAFSQQQSGSSIQLPQSLFSCEEVLLINTIGSFNAYKCLPLDVEDFWTLFILSLYLSPTVDYLYKFFINKWHQEKRVPLPDLSIYEISPETLPKIVSYFKLFLNYFYNSHSRLSSARLIKACWSEKLLNVFNRANITNDSNPITITISDNFLDVGEIKIFACILQKKFDYCLYYKSNVNFKIEIDSVDREKKQYTLDRNTFKLCFRLKPHSIKILNAEKLRVYIGNGENTEQRFFLVRNDFDGVFNDYRFQILQFSDKDNVSFGFLKVKPPKIRPLNISIDNRPSLLAIQSKVNRLGSRHVCTIIGFDPEYAFLNFLNIGDAEGTKRTDILQSTLPISVIEFDPTSVPTSENIIGPSINKHVLEIDASNG